MSQSFLYEFSKQKLRQFLCSKCREHFKFVDVATFLFCTSFYAKLHHLLFQMSGKCQDFLYLLLQYNKVQYEIVQSFVFPWGLN